MTFLMNKIVFFLKVFSCFLVEHGNKSLAVRETDTYSVLFGDGTVSHSTSISHIDMRLSCGTFCEANLKMEQKQFEYIHRWISDLVDGAADGGSKYVLIGKGRELIPYVLEIDNALKGALSLVVAISPCKVWLTCSALTIAS